MLRRLLFGEREFLIHPSFNLALIVDAVETNHSLQENVKLRMASWVPSNLEEGLEHVRDDLLEVVHKTGCLVHIVQTGHLDEPSHVGREKLVVDNPSSEFVPLFNVAAVDGNTPFNKLILA